MYISIEILVATITGGVLLFVLTMVLSYKISAMRTDLDWKKRLPYIRQEAAQRSRHVITGLVTEQLAPFLPGFPFNPNNCHFLGKPIDFFVFNEGDPNHGILSEIIFVEVKSGNAKLSSREKQFQDAVINKRVSWYEYRVPELG